jgi:hypothetical protein
MLVERCLEAVDYGKGRHGALNLETRLGIEGPIQLKFLQINSQLPKISAFALEMGDESAGR